MTNAFLAALLKVAAEERLREESLRNQAENFANSPIAFVRSAYDRLNEEADEHEGRAEVYERFATRLIGEIAGEMLTAEVYATLSGEPALLDFSQPVPWQLEYTPTLWQQNYLRWYQPMIIPPKSFIITTTN